MLINCKECNNLISDKAVMCPHCGLPLKATAPIRKAKYKRLPNGFGNIKKLSGNRRKPYVAYPPVKEYSITGSAITRSALGYYETYQDAYAALSEYNKNPFDIDKIKITFGEVYKLWQEDKYIKDKSKTLSASSYSTSQTALKHLKPICDRPVRSLKAQELQATIDGIQLKRSSIENVVWVLKNVFKYALQNDWIDKDYSQFVKINKPNDDEKGVPFTEEEIAKLWDNAADKNIRIILFMIYTGFRISEIETLTFYPEEHYCQGGLKTKAGKDRIVPINDCVYDFINDIHYDVCVKEWRESRFYPAIKQLGIETSVKGTKHTPHDCRHTFSWLCDKYNVDEFSKHLIMGHTLGNDIERKTYGHRTPEELLFEVNKIKKPII